MQAHLRSELVVAALEMVVWTRRPAEGLIHHSDHGCQYTSVLFGERFAAVGIRSSRGTFGDCFDNALVESVFATLECELLSWDAVSADQLNQAAYSYVHGVGLSWGGRFLNSERPTSWLLSKRGGA
jgi:putative transposase